MCASLTSPCDIAAAANTSGAVLTDKRQHRRLASLARLRQQDVQIQDRRVWGHGIDRPTDTNPHACGGRAAMGRSAPLPW